VIQQIKQLINCDLCSKCVLVKDISPTPLLIIDGRTIRKLCEYCNLLYVSPLLQKYF